MNKIDESKKTKIISKVFNNVSRISDKIPSIDNIEHILFEEYLEISLKNPLQELVVR